MTTRELEDVKHEYRLQVLTFDKCEWDWVYAKDFIPAT